MPTDIPKSPNILDANFQITPGSVHVWSVSIAACQPDVKALLALLADDEVERANRFVFEKDRTSFVVGRSTLRALLGQCLAERPRDVRLVTNPFGKPELNSKTMYFNVSHSADLVLIAACRDHAIGVDVEQIRLLEDLDQLIVQYFSPREAEELREFSGRQRPAAFFACWTRKEAYVKARGHGLSLPLDEFDVPTGPHAAHSWQPVQAEGSSQWYVVALPVCQGYSGAGDVRRELGRAVRGMFTAVVCRGGTAWSTVESA